MLFPRTLHTLKPQQAVLCNSLVWNTKLFNLLTSIPRQDKTSIFTELLDGSKKSSSLHSLQWFNLSSEQQELTHQALAYVQVSLQATQQMWTAYQASLPHPYNQATAAGASTAANAGNAPHPTATANSAAAHTTPTPTSTATTATGATQATQEVKEFTRTIIDNQELDDIYDPNLALLHHSDYKQRHSYEIPLDHPSYRELTAQGETVDPTAPITDFTVSNFDLEFFSAEFENDFTAQDTEQESTYLFDTELLTKLARQANLLTDDAELPATFSKLGFATLGNNPTVAQILRNSEVRELIDGLSQDLYVACTKLVGRENFHWLLPQEGNHEWGDRTPAAWYLWVVNWMLLTNTKVEQLRHEKLLNIGAKFHLETLPWQRQVAQTSFQALADWDEEQASLIARSKYLPQSITPREAEKVFFPTLQELTTLQHKLPSYLELRDNFRMQQLEARRNLYSSIYNKLAAAHNNPKILAALAASQTQVTPVADEQSFAQWLPAQLESIRYIESNYLQANYTLNYLNANNAVVVPSKGTGTTAKVKAKTSAELAAEQEDDTLQESNNSASLAQENLDIVATISAASAATAATTATSEASEEASSTTLEREDALLKFTMLDLETPTSSNPWYNLGIYAGLPSVPNRINCFDVSHLNGEFTKASCVVRDQQGIVPNEYRHYNITGITPGDDMAAIAQATFKRLDGIVDLSEVPDILLIDGKTTQCKAANLVYVQYQPLINQKVIYWNLITAGQHLLQFTARKQNRLFGNQESNQLGLLAVERFYQLRTKVHLELQALELAPLCWDTGLRLATAVQQLQITNDRLTNALAMLLAFADMHEERWTQSTFGTMENLAALKSLPNTQTIPWRRLNWLTQQPLETTFEQLFAEVHLVEYYARNLHPCAIVGVYKQFNRKTHAELFLNGRTNTNITIPQYSSEQFILLDLRDRAHNYANTKRLAAQDKTMHNNQDILASIPGLGQVSLKKIYAHFKDTGGLLEWYQRDGSLSYLVNQVGLTNKVAQLLLEHLPKLFTA